MATYRSHPQNVLVGIKNAIQLIPTVFRIPGIPLEIEDNGVAGQKPTHEDGEFLHQ
jgi:hypothetical protein